MTETLLVTGAGGTVGNYVVSLAEAEGYRVIASDLTSRSVRVPVRGEVRAGDLRSPEFVSEVARGADHVIHAAAKLDVDTDPSELMRINADVVSALYAAAKRAGARRFLHVSTAMLYGTGETGPIGEDAPLASRGPHTESKLAAERFLEGCPPSDLPWTIVRPAPLYGRRGRHFAAGLLAVGPTVRLSTPVLPRIRGGPLGTMVHAEDVARALLFLIPKQEATGEAFNVSDGDAMTLGDRLTATFEAYGLTTVPTGPLPRRSLGALGRFFSAPVAYHGADRAALLLWELVVRRHGLKRALRPRLDREALTLLYADLVVSADRIRALGFEPRFSSFVEGWGEVLRWYQAERWVPRFS